MTRVLYLHLPPSLSPRMHKSPQGGVYIRLLYYGSMLLLLLSHFSRVRLCAAPWTAAHQAPHPWDSPGKNTGVGCHFLLQCMKVKSESEAAQLCPLLATPWTANYQAPQSMGFSRQEYWSGVPLPSPKHLLVILNRKKKIRYFSGKTFKKKENDS